MPPARVGLTWRESHSPERHLRQKVGSSSKSPAPGGATHSGTQRYRKRWPTGARNFDHSTRSAPLQPATPADGDWILKHLETSGWPSASLDASNCGTCKSRILRKFAPGICRLWRPTSYQILADHSINRLNSSAPTARGILVALSSVVKHSLGLRVPGNVATSAATGLLPHP